jgi:hypothetical protein
VIMPLDHAIGRRRAFARAVRLGLMCERHYRFIGKILNKDASCTLLVFGLGYDSAFWISCVGGRITFVEDNPTYLAAARPTTHVISYSYRSRVGKWRAVPPPPWQIDMRWDYILVDGPTGFNRSCPGRQFPIAWARNLARKQVFVHDYERRWERALCDKFLGQPVEVIPPPGPRGGHLAVFSARARCTAFSSSRTRWHRYRVDRAGSLV